MQPDPPSPPAPQPRPPRPARFPLRRVLVLTLLVGVPFTYILNENNVFQSFWPKGQHAVYANGKAIIEEANRKITEVPVYGSFFYRTNALNLIVDINIRVDSLPGNAWPPAGLSVTSRISDLDLPFVTTTVPAPSLARVAWAEREIRELALAGGKEARIERWPAKTLKFAVSAAWGAAIVAALCGPLSWWRRYRLQRAAAKGLCPHCGYHVATLTTCPECGTPNQHSTSAPNAHQP